MEAFAGVFRGSLTVLDLSCQLRFELSRVIISRTLGVRRLITSLESISISYQPPEHTY